MVGYNAIIMHGARLANHREREREVKRSGEVNSNSSE